MDLINAIAEYFDCPNSAVTNIKVVGKLAWFRMNETEYTCTVSRGKFLKPGSIRLA